MFYRMNRIKKNLYIVICCKILQKVFSKAEEIKNVKKLLIRVEKSISFVNC